MVGRVVSIKMQNTAVVITERQKKHPLYQKTFTRTKKYLVDDQMGAKLGDVVIFGKIKPISKRKHWAIIKILGVDIVSLGTAQMQEKAAQAISEVLPEKEKPSSATHPSGEGKATMGKKEEKEKTDEKDKVKKEKVTKKGGSVKRKAERK
ncbi:mitochondrial small ribosomal subunit protein uS17m [Candidatus Daviesbacteria bacterium]|nr:mitochondrial small ribosomal subunit protein uS17m [Candidatus Daviesbacteria bacterium]